MNRKETVIEANRQIHLLMLGCSDNERKQLNKRVRPIPALPQRRYSQPVRIGAILPGVMANIEQRIADAKAVSA